MIANQVSVFLENKPGRLERITSVLKDAGINIRAMTLSTSSAGWGILNLLVDRPQEAAEVLKGTGHPAALREIVVVRMADAPGALHDMLVLLAKAGINVQNAYGTVLGDQKTAILVIDVEDIEHTQKLFTDAGVETLSKDQIYRV
ncbi:MAG: ACT domain-containing protein [Syntrophotaleaceae bacterium]